MRLALLGDSIAYGQGAARDADTPAALLGEALRGHGFDVVSRVFAVPGARSSGLAAQVRHALRWRPDASVLVIGANDLTNQVPAQKAAGHLGTAVRRLVTAGAQVVVAPAPDLSILPDATTAARELLGAASRRLRALQAEAVLAAGGRVADPGNEASAAFATDASLFSEDRFHPSSAGYQVIAEALLPELLAAARAAGGARGLGDPDAGLGPVDRQG